MKQSAETFENESLPAPRECRDAATLQHDTEMLAGIRIRSSPDRRTDKLVTQSGREAEVKDTGKGLSTFLGPHLTPEVQD